MLLNFKPTYTPHSNTQIGNMNLLMVLFVAQAHAFFFGQQQQQQQQQASYEDRVLDSGCAKYLCSDTLECVDSWKDCPCPFPKSQLKCMLPKGSNRPYVCISKPATHDEKLNLIYDDPVQGPKAAIKGMRDCGWVQQNL